MNSAARRPCVTRTRPIIYSLLPRGRADAGLPPCHPGVRPCLCARQLEKIQPLSIFPPIVPQHEPSDGGRQYTQRSEEHTSELQSLMRTSYAVFCLKKKKNST